MSKIDKVLYTGKTHTTGGRDGASRSSDGRLDIKLSPPGSNGAGTNPEQLFAAGYAACFLGSMKFVAAQQKMTLPAEASVTAAVGIGLIPSGFGIEAELWIRLPGLAIEDAQALVEQAHIVCPYSNATHGNIDVRLNLV